LPLNSSKQYNKYCTAISRHIVRYPSTQITYMPVWLLSNMQQSLQRRRWPCSQTA